MKKLIPAYILSFIISFMLYIVEPINMFVNNRADFHFNFSSLVRPIIIVSLLLFILLSGVFTLIYYVNKKFSKKLTFYNIILIIAYILFFMMYIQGNYMIGSLPVIDGAAIDWSIYLKENIITIVILLIITGVYVFCVRKYKFEKVINTSKYISLAVFAMLFVSFIPALLNKEIYKNDDNIFVNNFHINNISNNKNFLMFVLDATDSKTFASELEKGEYKDMLKDFTYYPDTLSMYIFTRESIPYILTGKVNYNETDFETYYNEAMDNSPLMNRLVDENYKINLYELDTKWNSEKSKVVQNVGVYNKSLPSKCYLKQQTKYDLFKYLPFFLKKYSKIDHFSMDSCKIDYDPDAFSFNDRPLYDTIVNNSLEKIEDNYFSFIHIEGGHVPFDLDENLERISDGTYEQKIDASIKIVNSYIERLKASGEYDNSVIIVMSDHGFEKEDVKGTRANPILYIKGLNEHHDMITSDKAISYADLMDAYNDLLDGKKSTELFSNIGSERLRKYIWYMHTKEDHKVEMATNGKAWEYDKVYETGKEFNR